MSNNEILTPFIVLSSMNKRIFIEGHINVEKVIRSFQTLLLIGSTVIVRGKLRWSSGFLDRRIIFPRETLGDRLLHQCDNHLFVEKNGHIICTGIGCNFGVSFLNRIGPFYEKKFSSS